MSDKRRAAPTVRVRTTTGGWLLIHASHLHGSVGDIAVIIEPAHPSSIAPLLLSSRGLTPANMTSRSSCCAGASTRAIAAELHLVLSCAKRCTSLVDVSHPFKT